MTPTATRLQYTNGYLELGMFNEAAEEMDYIIGDDRMSLRVMRMRMKMYKQAEYWPELEAVSKFVAKQAPRKPEGWVNWSNALREQDKIEDAKKVALHALERHPNNARLRFSLGCYCSLLGEVQEAKEHVRKAVQLDKSLQQASVDDPDLDNLWEGIASIE
ncbi:tetratricopeptide repeat protein [Opitutaceae bacterium]|nr:tetratricopeptide repeat protein [Opitutaceae bacterium]